MADRPTKEQVRARRTAAGLTQEAAADIVGVDARTWQYWEAGRSRMRAGLWRLFVIDTEAAIAAANPDSAE